MSATLTTIAILGLAATSGHNLNHTSSKALMHRIPDAQKQVQVVYPTCAMPALRCIPCEQSPADGFSTPEDKPHNNGTCKARPLSKKKAQQRARAQKLSRHRSSCVSKPQKRKSLLTCEQERETCTQHSKPDDQKEGELFFSALTRSAKSILRFLNFSNADIGATVRCLSEHLECKGNK